MQPLWSWPHVSFPCFTPKLETPDQRIPTPDQHKHVKVVGFYNLGFSFHQPLHH